MDTHSPFLAPVRPSGLPPIVAIKSASMEREAFDWRRPFRRRHYVLTYQARRSGVERWETYCTFHRTLAGASKHLNFMVQFLHGWSRP